MRRDLITEIGTSTAPDVRIEINTEATMTSVIAVQACDDLGEQTEAKR